LILLYPVVAPHRCTPMYPKIALLTTSYKDCKILKTKGASIFLNRVSAVRICVRSP
jgi:hypothetical protein